MCDWIESGSSIKKFIQSKQTEARFMNGQENTPPITNLNKI
jgi:ribosome-associated protein YbcJ (S4-like RNA binding protein)